LQRHELLLLILILLILLSYILCSIS
jgi:hypothetical protein